MEDFQKIHYFPPENHKITTNLVFAREDRGNVARGDFPGRPNSSAVIRRVLENLNIPEDELINRLRRVIPEARQGLFESCIITAQQMDEAIIARGTTNGFVTKDGRNVIKQVPPRHRGSKYKFY